MHRDMMLKMLRYNAQGYFIYILLILFCVHLIIDIEFKSECENNDRLEPFDKCSAIFASEL